MVSATSSAPVSKKLFWAGCIVSALPVLMLVMSGVMKLIKADAAMDGFPKLGWNPSIAVPLGIVELTCTLLYVIPQTSVLGAILLTGYLGGAVATHVRIDEPFYTPVILGVLVWLGLYLRYAKLRAMFPLKG
ncbi:MAG TPA: DoxX family protein [Gemmataceae bacterium]|jgi:hypothetical protein|nr:DoxX family protein [Gemmataceae bacterium]